MPRTRTASPLGLLLFLLWYAGCGKPNPGAFSACGIQPAPGGLLSGRGIIDVKGRCLLPEEPAWRNAQVFVPASAAEVLSAAGAGILRVNANGLQQDGEQGYVVLVYVPPGSHQFTLTLARASYPWKRRSYQFSVDTWKGNAALRSGSDSLLNGEIDAADRQLAAALSATEPATRTFAQLRLAEIAGERGQAEQMLTHLTEVQKLAEQHGYLSLHASSLLFQAELLSSRRESALGPAVAALKSVESLSSGLPVLEAWHSLYRGRLHRVRGDFVRALHELEQGLHVAQKHLLQDAGAQLCTLKTQLLQKLGRSVEADRACSDIEGWMHMAALEPCLQAHSRLTIARSLLGRYEGTWPPNGTIPQSLSDNLEVAERLLENLCRNQDDLLNFTQLYKAQAKLLAGELATASIVLDGAEKKMGKDARADHFRVLLRGQLALEKKEWREAEGFFKEYLGEEAQKSEAAPGDKVDRETQWNGYVGLAQVHEGLAEAEKNAQRQAAETVLAVENYRKSERVLDDWSFDVQRLPLAEGRHRFLERYKRGTSLYLSLLARRKRNAEALNVLLHAHRRTLGATLIEQLRQERAQGLRERYWTERRKQEQERASTPPDSVEAREQQLTTMTRPMLSIIEDWLAKETDRETQAPSLPLAADELLLACYPGRISAGRINGEICLAATPDKPLDPSAIEILSSLSPESNRAELGEALLKPFAMQLEKVKTIRALANETLLRIPLHLLSLSGELVGTRRRVVYTLGLAPQHTPAADRKSADSPRRVLIMVPEPARYQLDAEAVNETVLPQLKQLGWSVPDGWLMLGNPVPTGNGVSSLDFLKELRERLENAWLLHFAGHVADGEDVRWLPGVTTGLQSPPIMLSDILMLSRVVPHVLLVGCQTGAGSGSNIGLGQAFLLRGTQEAVVSTERIKTGSPFVKRLYPHLRNDDDALPLASAFQRALAGNREHTEDFKSFFVLTR